MPEGGKVRISAAKVRIGGSDKLPLKEGQQVRISVEEFDYRRNVHNGSPSLPESRPLERFTASVPPLMIGTRFVGSFLPISESIPLTPRSTI
jgi:hypothetical protein